MFKIIHLHSCTVDSIRAVIFLCLSFPICEMVQVRICSFTTVSSHTLVPLRSHTNFLFWRQKERAVIKTAYERASLILSQWLHSKGWTMLGHKCRYPQGCGKGSSSLPGLQGSHPLMPNMYHVHQSYTMLPQRFEYELKLRSKRLQW